MILWYFQRPVETELDDDDGDDDDDDHDHDNKDDDDINDEDDINVLNRTINHYVTGGFGSAHQCKSVKTVLAV